MKNDLRNESNNYKMSLLCVCSTKKDFKRWFKIYKKKRQTLTPLFFFIFITTTCTKPLKNNIRCFLSCLVFMYFFFESVVAILCGIVKVSVKGGWFLLGCQTKKAKNTQKKSFEPLYGNDQIFLGGLFYIFTHKKVSL